MKRSVESVRLMSKNFHDVDFTALRPLTVETFVIRHHPECRQISLSRRNLKSGFDASICKRMFSLSIYASRSIGYASVVIDFFKRLNYKESVLDVGIFL